MTSILSGLATVQQALTAEQFALSIAQNNVANVNDPNYTCQNVVFTPVGDDSGSGDSGASIQTSRDRYLDYSITQELPSLGENTAASNALQQVDAIFGGSSGGSLQQALSNFFNSFSSLSGSPEDLSLRQGVISSADDLVTEIQGAYRAIQQVQSSADGSVKDDVDSINSITAQIADLNQKIADGRQSSPSAESTLQDNRQQLLEQLSNLVGISYTETESGAVTVTTQQGGVLVLGNESNDLTVTHSGDNAFWSVQLNGADITDQLQSGDLGGQINLRDNTLSGYLNALDNLAATITSSVNNQQAQGTDLNGQAGVPLFTPFVQAVPGSNTGAASAMSVAITDPSQIAAAAPGAGVADNTNAQLLAGLGNENLFAGSTQTATQYYAQLLYQVGEDESNAENGVQTQTSLVQQLKSQRASESGVDLNEEAANIMQYQQAYQASSQMAKVLDDLSADILNFIGTDTVA